MKTNEREFYNQESEQERELLTRFFKQHKVTKYKFTATDCPVDCFVTGKTVSVLEVKKETLKTYQNQILGITLFT